MGFLRQWFRLARLARRMQRRAAEERLRLRLRSMLEGK